MKQHPNLNNKKRGITNDVIPLYFYSDKFIFIKSNNLFNWSVIWNSTEAAVYISSFWIIQLQFLPTILVWPLLIVIVNVWLIGPTVFVKTSIDSKSPNPLS